MKIFNENKQLVNINKIERPEQDLVEKYILEDDVVLELGARYGSVSCKINLNLKNKFNQVSVEPDKRVWTALKFNKIINKCKFHIIKGFISKKN